MYGAVSLSFCVLSLATCTTSTHSSSDDASIAAA